MGCIFCCQHDSTDDERQPILAHQPEQVAIESARQRPPHPNGSEQNSGGITPRHVGVPDLDQRFQDVAETFNEQQKHYECMNEKMKTLMFRYRCSSESSLSDCLTKIRHENDILHVSLHAKGYNFTLVVMPDDDVPDKLKKTQENVKELFQNAKAIVSAGTKLQEMINWLLKAEERLNQQVTDSVSDHQERTRKTNNLRRNLQEAKRAKELFSQYKKEADKLFKEAALLSGMAP